MTISHAARLLSRLDAIAASLASRDDALALIGLGSVGIETHRLDAYSDLDFFVVVSDGAKARYIDDLAWLGAVHPLAFAFQNTRDGHKALFADGIFCEFAIFELPELAGIAYAPGRIVWKRDGVPDDIQAPKTKTGVAEAHTQAWALGEALTNLYVGLGRDRRGERLSAMRFVQSYAVDRVIELWDARRVESRATPDAFALERRVEQRHPDLAARLPSFCQGYARNIESARAILAFLEEHFDVNPDIAQAIRGLCA